MADGVTTGRLGRARLRLQMEHGVDARHAELHFQGSGPSQASPRRHRVRAALRVLRELHPAALARRGRARQALDPRPHAGRSVAAFRQSARLLRLHVRTSGQEAHVHGLRVRPGTGMEPRSQSRLAPRSTSAPYAGIQALVRDLNGLYRSLPALHELDCDPAGFEWIVVDDWQQSVFAWMRKGRDPRRAASWSSTSRPRCAGLRRQGAVRRQLARGPEHRCRCSTAAPMWATAASVPAVRRRRPTRDPPHLPPLGALFLVPEH